MDNEIAQYLNLTHEEYKNILHKHNGIDCGPTRITFNDKSDAEAAIKTLEPFLILAVLTEG